MRAIQYLESSLAKTTITVFFAATLIYLLTPYGAAISPDSISYLDIAQHIHNGDGWRSTDFSLAHYGEHRSIPNTTWPPLYPLLLAITGYPPNPHSAAFTSFILLSCTLLLTQQILRPVAGNIGSLLLSLPLGFSIPILTVYTFAWSEQLFIAVTLALLLSIQTYFLADSDNIKKRTNCIASATVFSILAFYTRYIGIIYFPFLFLIYFFSGRPKHLTRLFAICYALHLIGIASLIAYNISVSGSASGAYRTASTESFSAQVHDAISALATFFVSSDKAALALLCTALALPVFCFMMDRERKIADENSRRFIQHPLREPKHTGIICFGFIFYYLLSICILRTFVKFDDIDIRLLSVLAPIFWIGGIALVIELERIRKNIIFISITLIPLVLLGFNGYFALFDVRKNLQVMGDHHYSMGVHGYAYRNFNPAPQTNEIKLFFSQITDKNSVLVTDRPLFYQFLTGLICIQKPYVISGAEIERLAQMPKNSLMSVNPNDAESISQQLKQHNATSSLIQAGDQLFIPLPITVDNN